MKRIIPDEVYSRRPCSVVSIGCALGLTDRKQIRAIVPDGLKNDGYLSLDGMNRLVRSVLPVEKKEVFKRGQRPILRDLMKDNHRRAVVCLLGHFIYIDGDKYYSFFRNGDSPVVCVWWLKEVA